MATKTWDSPQMVVGKHNYVSRIVIYSLLAVAALVYLVPMLVMLLT